MRKCSCSLYGLNHSAIELKENSDLTTNKQKHPSASIILIHKSIVNKIIKSTFKDIANVYPIQTPHGSPNSWIWDRILQIMCNDSLLVQIFLRISYFSPLWKRRRQF